MWRYWLIDGPARWFDYLPAAYLLLLGAGCIVALVTVALTVLLWALGYPLL